MHQEQRQRTTDLLRSQGIERALFANYDSVRWLTGCAPSVQLGPNFFLGGPPLVWYDNGHFTLMIVNVHAPFASGLEDDTDISVVTYTGYTIDEPLATGANLAAVLTDVLTPSRGSGAVGIEQIDITVQQQKTLLETLGDGTEIAPIDGWLVPLRWFKTDEELDKLRENFRLTDMAHAKGREIVAAGLREIDVWTAIHEVVQREAGERVPFGNDCLVGYREANVGGWPLDYALREHDALILDLSTVKYGYWSDSCGTYYAGEPTAKQIAMHNTVMEALEFGISLLRPGAVCREVDFRIRQFLIDAGYPETYPHHTGHSIGVSGHESPRIVGYNDETIEAGMVMLLEPGIYFPGETGVRLEDAVLVKQDGVELLTGHDKSLP